jgi:hypothetical protein
MSRHVSDALQALFANHLVEIPAPVLSELLLAGWSTCPIQGMLTFYVSYSTRTGFLCHVMAVMIDQ